MAKAEDKLYSINNEHKAGAQAPALVMKEDGLSLSYGELSLTGDFKKMKNRLRQDSLSQELLVKAAKLRRAGKSDDGLSAQGAQVRLPFAVDATAGLGEDSLLLAAAGFRVIMFERDPVIAALLEDALLRAAEDEELKPLISRMELRKEDSISGMRCLCERPDIILLDPMFPERQKSGLIKKKLQLIKSLERPCEDEEELLASAVSARPLRIIIKRPLKGPFLAGRKPSYSIRGSVIRYDCIVL